MSEISRFFNSIDHDRLYSAADWAAYFKAFIGNGVIPLPSDQLLVSAGTGTGLSLSVAAGKAFINGYFYENTDAKALTCSTADGTNPRIDRVVVRYSRASREMYLAVLTGVAAASPVPPALSRTADTWELCLADVAVARGATALSNVDITDTRGSAEPDVNGQIPCGFVSWFLNEAGDNYDDFWQQFRAEFYVWLDSMDRQIDPDTLAGIAQRLAQLTPVDIALTLEAADWVYDSTNRIYTLTIAPNDITYQSGGQTVTYPVSDATAAYADLDMAEATADDAADLEDGWAQVGRISVDSYGLHATCYGDVPAVDLPVILRVVDKA